MALINFSGIASGIDSSSLIASLLAQERAARIKPLQDRITELNDTNSAFSDLKTKLLDLKSKASVFRTLSGSGLIKNATSSDESTLSATAASSASNGSYSIEVGALAKNATYSFKSTLGSYGSTDDMIAPGMIGTDSVHFEIGLGSELQSFDIDVSNSTTLSQFVNEFNGSTTKATASLVNAGTAGSPDYRLVVTTNDQGTDKGSINVTTGVGITSANAFDDNSVSQASNAELQLLGIGAGSGDIITRSSNTISDIIPGLTLNLQSIGSATVSISDDSSATAARVQDFVDAFNDVVNYIKENDLVTSENDGETTTNTFGPFSTSSLDENIVTALRAALTNAGTTGRSVNVLSDIGVTTQRDGTLKFDSQVFENAMTADAEGVRTITQNLGDTLANTGGSIDQFTRFGGLIDILENQNNDQVSSYESNITTLEKQITEHEQSLTARFSKLEALIGKLNSQQSALTSLLA